jgi:hypothetical protein
MGTGVTRADWYATADEYAQAQPHAATTYNTNKHEPT